MDDFLPDTPPLVILCVMLGLVDASMLYYIVSRVVH